MRNIGHYGGQMADEAEKPDLSEQTAFWRDDGLVGAEFLRGTYRNFSYAPHAHDRCFLAVITGGALEIIEPHQSAVAATGQVILYNYDLMHWSRGAGDNGWSISSIYLPPSYIAQTAGELGVMSRGTIGFLSIVRDDWQLAQRIAFLCNLGAQRLDVLGKESMLLEILGDVLTRHANCEVAPTVMGRESRGTRIVRDFIDAHYSCHISLKKLSDLSGLQRYWLIKAFKIAYGVPPYVYLTTVRVRRAQHLLREGANIAQAALACGFADQSHLSRVFKRCTGLTPGLFKC